MTKVQSVFTIDGIHSLIFSNWKKVIVAGIAGMVVSYAGSFLIAPTWRASAVLQIGRIFVNTERLVEPAPEVVGRLGTSAFLDGVLERLGYPVTYFEDDNTDLIRDSFSAYQVYGTNFVDISVRGFSPEMARNVVLKAAAEISAEHQTRVDPFVERQTATLNRVKLDLVAAEKRQDDLYALVAEADSKGEEATSASIIGLNLISNNEYLLRDLKNRQSELQERLDPRQTYGTSIVGDVYVSPRPVAPRRVVIAVAGGALAGALMLAWILSRAIRIQYRPD